MWKSFYIREDLWMTSGAVFSSDFVSGNLEAIQCASFDESRYHVDEFMILSNGEHDENHTC